jgi:hypothetical protein
MPYVEGIHALLCGKNKSAAKKFRKCAEIAETQTAVYMSGYSNYLCTFALQESKNATGFTAEIANRKQQALAAFTKFGMDHEIRKVNEFIK